MRSPAVTFGVGVTARLPAPGVCAAACCTNATIAADGVTAFDGADAGPLPFGLVAVTVNVYVVPLVRPVTVGSSAPAIR